MQIDITTRRLATPATTATITIVFDFFVPVPAIMYKKLYIKCPRIISNMEHSVDLKIYYKIEI